MTYTIESVKEELPQVKVKIGNKIVTANVSGRKNKFATVWVKGNDETGYEFSWKTIANSLNNNRPLIV